MSPVAVLLEATFIRYGIAWFLAAGFIFGFTFLIGARAGAVAAYRFKRTFGWVFLGVAALLAGWGYTSGQMVRFTGAWGLGSLFEMVLLGFGWVGTMWFMATSYVNSKMLDIVREQERSLSADAVREDG